MVKPGSKSRSTFFTNDTGNTAGDKMTKPLHAFDKKTYRLKKYSKKYQLDKWENQRRQKLLRTHFKEISCDPLNGKFMKREENTEDEIGERVPGQFVLLPEKLAERQVEKKKSHNSKKAIKHDSYSLAKQEYRRIQEDKTVKQEAKLKADEEREQALQEYKKKKAERYKKLSQKTRRGQPVMKGRLELLYEKIQKNLQ